MNRRRQRLAATALSFAAALVGTSCSTPAPLEDGLAFGDGWRLPTDGEWRELARHFGGVFDDAQDRGNSAYHALLRGGRSGFDAVLGGGRAADGQYDDLDAHGFYWTASEDAPATALFYNFGRGSTALYRQTDGDKPMALSVRCIQ